MYKYLPKLERKKRSRNNKRTEIKTISERMKWIYRTHTLILMNKNTRARFICLHTNVCIYSPVYQSHLHCTSYAFEYSCTLLIYTAPTLFTFFHFQYLNSILFSSSMNNNIQLLYLFCLIHFFFINQVSICLNNESNAITSR